jgi:hypothetical protein
VRVRQIPRRLKDGVVASVLRLDDRFESDVYYGQRLARRVAPRNASGWRRGLVLIAGVLFATGRWRRPLPLLVDAPEGVVRFVIPDYAGFKVLDEMFYRREYGVELDPPPASIVDIGAHVGVSALFFHRRWPTARILAVEPNPEHAGNQRVTGRNHGGEVRLGPEAERPGGVRGVAPGAR